MPKQLAISYAEIMSSENLLGAWEDFVKGKRAKRDVQEFGVHLMDNIFDLERDLRYLRYKHGEYKAFKINDPKPRDIHKATVRDRLLHHAIYRKLYPFFDSTFISHSFSCRRQKGTHRACDSFSGMVRKVSRNNTRTAWVLKCDIRKFFASIDHGILFGILRKRIGDKKILWLLYQVVSIFSSDKPGVGLPLGNLTSQLLVNIYMNEFDQYVKHGLKGENYIRYADDFVFASEDKVLLGSHLVKISEFLRERLKLEIHPNKVAISTFASGIDFLGWVHFPYHRVLRTTTKKRAFRNTLRAKGNPSVTQSYLGLFSHGNAWKISQDISTIDPKVDA